MYHPRTHYDDSENLKAELEQEKRYRETIEWSNAELERSIMELETYLRELDENSKGAVDDNEWKVRFESQTALNKQLQEQKDWLEAELMEARRKLTTGSYPEAMNFNLDALNEPELLRLVKHLERMRNDVYSTLRDTEWKLDKEAKEFHHFDEMRRVYRVDLKHANHSIERMRLSTVLDPSGIVSPIYPTGYFRWLDSHTPIPIPPVPMNMLSVGYGDRGGKSGQGKKGGGGGNGKSPGNLEPNPNPPRSKSRAEKKAKKKENAPEEPDPRKRNGNSEMDNGNGTDVSLGDQDATGKQSNLSSGGDSSTKEETREMRISPKERHEEGEDNQ